MTKLKQLLTRTSKLNLEINTVLLFIILSIIGLVAFTGCSQALLHELARDHAEDGANGLNGVDGAAGADGICVDGKDGKDGVDGEPGADGHGLPEDCSLSYDAKFIYIECDGGYAKLQLKKYR